MPKTLTLRLDDATYRRFRDCAATDRRSIANLVETAALRHLEESAEIAPEELKEIRANKTLTRKLRAGSRDARLRRGRRVG